MPPKKEPRQSTLGSFFSLPAGTKPPVKTQPKLARGAASKSSPKKPKEDVEPPVEDAAALKLEEKDEDAVMADAESPAKSDDDVASTTATGATKRRRSKSPKIEAKESDAEIEEDDEPVTKRGRKSKKDMAKTKKAEIESEEPSPEPVEEAPKKRAGRKKKEEEEVETKESTPEPVEEASKKRGRSKKVVAEEEDLSAEEATPASPKSPKRKSKSPSPALDADDPRKPAITEKARKEVQATLLKEKSKHAYPDWPAGAPTPYAALVATFNKIEATTKRLEKLSHTSLFLRQVLRLSPDELLLVVHLMINRLAADYEGVELGIGESILLKAIGESCGRSQSQLKADLRESGDLGEVALESRKKQRTLFKPKPLTVKAVHSGLKDIATTIGKGGQGVKVGLINKLLSSAQDTEAKYLVRGLEGKLRLGLQEKTLIVALSQAVVVHEHEQAGKKAPSIEVMAKAEEMLKSVYSELPNYEIVIGEMMKPGGKGIMGLKETCKLQPGVPLKPMLAKPTKSISEVLDRFDQQAFTCEYKYDGERVQVHYISPDSPHTFPSHQSNKTLAKIFSRNSEELSPKYPDILASLPHWVAKNNTSFVLDCEAVAFDKEQKRVLPFQQLMTRKRKDVKEEDVKVRVCVFAFDLLFLNGESLVQLPLDQRREKLYSAFEEKESEFAFATKKEGRDVEQIQEFLEESIKASCEGLMVKMLTGPESTYEPSKRSRNWLKVKKDYLASSGGDSLDLVVIGAYYGKGKRTNWYGAFLLACYNPATQEFESVCNIGTGFSEEVLEAQYNTLKEYEIEKPKPYYLHPSGGQNQPDVWFEPRVVWEVKAADLSLSPKYMAAAGLVRDDAGKGRGVSLRFPRFLRLRDDKKPEEATTGKQVAEMYTKQDVVASGAKASAGGVDDDFEY